MQQSETIIFLNLDLLVPNPYQPRKTFNDNTINELAASIKKNGVLNPILVRKKEEKYEIIAGERRCRAAKIAGLNQIPAIVKDVDDAKLAEIALIENLQRENLSPVEEAASYKEILDLTNLTEQNLSEIIGKSQPSISNKMRLLNLPDEVKNALNNRKISERHARSLLTVKDKEKQITLLDEIISKKLTVKELDDKINNIKYEDDNENIDDAINNILKSLNKKEEKESDNMNNGNFFPNYNNADANNNVSLNTVNMQAMPDTGVIPPSPVPAQNPLEQPMMFNPVEATPVVNSPQVEAPIQPEVASIGTPAENVSAIPSFGVNAPATPTVETPVPQDNIQPPVENVGPTNNFNDIPLFATQNVNPEPPAGMETIPESNNIIPEPQPTVENVPTPPVTPILPADEPPLFTATPTEIPQAPVAPVPAESTFEVPVETPVPAMPEDKFTQVKNLLDSNGVVYKAYSGETGSCIIIEL